MRLAMVWPVVKKEIRSTLRDRRAFAGSLLLPLLMFPLLILGVPLLLSRLHKRAEHTVSAIGVAGEADLPATLVKLLEARNVKLVEVSDPLTAVQQGDYQAALGVPGGFAQQIGQGKQVALTLYSKQGNLKSELASGRVRDALSVYQKEVGAARLKAVGLSEHILTPFSVTAIDASPKSKRGQGSAGWLIPFFIIFWMYIGGQATAIDATAGEKERGTLESILTAPIRRIEVVAGKFLAVMAFELAAALLSVLGYVASGLVLHVLKHHGFVLVSLNLGDALAFFTPYAVIVIALSGVVAAAFLAALLLSICLFAQSFREAQAYLAPLSSVMLILLIALPLSNLLNFGPGIFLVPIFNILLVINEVVAGTPALAHVLLSSASMLVFASLLFIFALRNFQRESVIFRTGSRIRAAPRGQRPTLSGQSRSPSRLAAVTEVLLRQPKVIAFTMTQFLVIPYSFVGWSQGISETEGTAFSYHQTHNLVAIVLGLCFMTVIEALPIHFFLAMHNARVAWIFDALNAYSLLWLLGHLNAMRLRPILLNDEKLHLRIGLFSHATVALADIEAVHPPDEALTEGRDYVNMAVFLFSFPPNLVLTLKEPVKVRRFDRLDKKAHRLGLVVDDVSQLKKELQLRAGLEQAVG